MNETIIGASGGTAMNVSPSVERDGNGRMQAPEIDVSLDFCAEERLRIEQQHDRANPDFKYVWQSDHRTREELSRKGMEVVNTASGNPIKNGADILCRLPVKIWEKRDWATEKQTQLLSQFVEDPDTLRRKAEPKKPKSSKKIISEE
jgi:hypothetical protein